MVKIIGDFGYCPVGDEPPHTKHDFGLSTTAILGGAGAPKL